MHGSIAVKLLACMLQLLDTRTDRYWWTNAPFRVRSSAGGHGNRPSAAKAINVYKTAPLLVSHYVGYCQYSMQPNKMQLRLNCRHKFPAKSHFPVIYAINRTISSCIRALQNDSAFVILNFNVKTSSFARNPAWNYTESPATGEKFSQSHYLFVVVIL